MKFKEERPLSNVDTAVRRLLEIANGGWRPIMPAGYRSAPSILNSFLQAVLMRNILRP
jgi:hypothetical protein